MKICVSCAQTVSSDTRYCFNCGGSGFSPFVCPHCGTELFASKAKFCTSCGKEIKLVKDIEREIEEVKSYKVSVKKKTRATKKGKRK